ncbi:unnamed protein product [Closterium sp. NIES-65]|nr:unnamed protein product [Closterium sp. NIES-65]
MLQSFKKTFVGGRKNHTHAASHNAGNAGAAAVSAASGGADAVGSPHPPAGAANPTALVCRVPNEIAQADLSHFAEEAFIQKLHLCSYLFDFNDPMKNMEGKEIKRQTLLELVDYVKSGTGKYNEAVFKGITRMLEVNLFRPLPSSAHEMSESESIDPELKKPTMEAAWPHLQIVYEFLLWYVVSSSETDADDVAKRYIDQEFVLKLLNLFDSEDPRERGYLKTIMHQIYLKFMEERKQILERALVPLHKPKCVSMYHQQLSYCITLFVEKDPNLADSVLLGLLEFWPLSNNQNELLFLEELEKILELTQELEFHLVMTPLFQQIALCLSSSHFQVAERTLRLWGNDYIVALVAQNHDTILPLIVAALERSAESHQNQLSLLSPHPLLFLLSPPPLPALPHTSPSIPFLFPPLSSTPPLLSLLFRTTFPPHSPRSTRPPPFCPGSERAGHQRSHDVS